MAIWSNRVLILLGALGIFLSGVLAYSSWKNIVVPCGGALNCSIVMQSEYATFLGINVSYIGLAGYVGLFALALLRSTNSGSMFRKLGVIGFGMSVVGLLFSLYLTYVSLTVLRIECVWCLSSLAIILVTTIMHAALLQADAPENNDRFMGLTGSAGSLIVALGTVGMVVRGQEQAIDIGAGLVDASVYSLEEILPGKAKVIGSADAKVTVVEFADVNCHACRISYPLVKDLLKKQGDGLRFAFRHFPLLGTPGHETSLKASIISELAAENNEFWKYMDAVMAEDEHDRVKTDEGLMSVAGKIGYGRGELLALINPRDEEQKARSKELMTRVSEDMDMGLEMSVNQTPTFIIYAEGKEPKAVSFNKLEATLMSSPYRELIEAGK